MHRKDAKYHCKWEEWDIISFSVEQLILKKQTWHCLLNVKENVCLFPHLDSSKTLWKAEDPSKASATSPMACMPLCLPNRNKNRCLNTNVETPFFLMARPHPEPLLFSSWKVQQGPMHAVKCPPAKVPNVLSTYTRVNPITIVLNSRTQTYKQAHSTVSFYLDEVQVWAHDRNLIPVKSKGQTCDCWLPRNERKAVRGLRW